MLKQYPNRTYKPKVNLFRLCGRKKPDHLKSNYFVSKDIVRDK